MNLLYATVTEIYTGPYFEYGKWWVSVGYECYGHFGNSSLMFDLEEDAKNVKIGDRILV